MSFRDNLQHLRATRNMTQEQLAMLLGVSRQSVTKWEAEKSYPEMDKLLKICQVFECSLDDLVQVGTIGLIKAIDRFDPERGLEFTTYATPTVMGEIKRHFRDKGWSVRVPRRLQELSAKINVATDELTNALQRSPSVAEIAEHVGASVDEVLEAIESSAAYSSVPLEGGGSGEDDESPAVIDHYATEDADLAASDDRMVLEQAIADFSPRERDVIRMRFVEGLTQVEIAERLGVSQVQVSRLLRRTLRRIQDKIDPEGIGVA